ncbi:MAG: hypothetical protein JOZ56_10250 [Actinobacteria bacterium]|nr:hypothetical protein [Actinomycetota bacterium]MBV8563460.1 hypothetical protein [Actinomycetota bacterium]
MTWLSWREQRTETLLALGLLALLAALLVPVGLHLETLYRQDNVAACLTQATEACHQAMGNFGNGAGALRSVLTWLTLLPGLLGAALAAPIILDLESGASVFAWTQGVTRTRWLATRLGVALLTSLAAAGALTLLVTWYRRPLDSAFGRFDNGVFDLEGTVPLAYAAFALGLGLAVGVVWRRTALSLIVGFLAYVGSRVFVDSWLRERYEAPLGATWGIRQPEPALRGAWILSSGPSDKAGHPFTGGFQVIESCARGVGGGIKSVDPACLARHGAGFNHAIYQPASRFWLFQGIETALFGGLAIVLIGFAAWWLLSRVE